MSTLPEVVHISANGPSGQRTVQIEMATPQTGLRNRVRQIPDGLAHLNSRVSDDRSSSESNLRNIAFALIRLDAWALNTIEHSSTTDPQLVGLFLYNEFKGLASNDVVDLADCDDNYENRFDDDVQHCLEKLSDGEILEVLCDLRTSTYYAQFIQLRTLLYTTVVAEHLYATNASNAPNLIIPKRLDWLKTPQEYLKYLTTERLENRQKLKSVIMGCRDLRDRVKYAAEAGEITPIALGALKKKLEALQANFREACIEVGVGIDSPFLIDPSILQWWDPSDKEIPQANTLNPPISKVVEAYPHSRSVIATLSFLVPTICLLSCIPAGLAWSHTPSTVGAYNDGDFYQLISSSSMQLLGIGTLILPTLFSTRLSRTSWVWTSVLTGTGIICTVVSVPLYLCAPTAWSGLLSFCGNVAQTLVLLQLMQSS